MHILSFRLQISLTNHHINNNIHKIIHTIIKQELTKKIAEHWSRNKKFNILANLDTNEFWEARENWEPYFSHVGLCLAGAVIYSMYHVIKEQRRVPVGSLLS